MLMPRILDADAKARLRLPRYVDKVRTLLHKHVTDWLELNKDTLALMASDPHLEHQMQRFLQLRHPVPLWSRSGPSQLSYRPVEQFSTAGAEMEAARLFLILLTWHDLDYVRRCNECRRPYVGVRIDQKFCVKSCRQKFASHDRGFMEKRRNYMRSRRADEKKDSAKYREPDRVFSRHTAAE
jgi:hypothetical protein